MSDDEKPKVVSLDAYRNQRDIGVTSPTTKPNPVSGENVRDLVSTIFSSKDGDDENLISILDFLESVGDENLAKLCEILDGLKVPVNPAKQVEPEKLVRTYSDEQVWVIVDSVTSSKVQMRPYFWMAIRDRAKQTRRPRE